MGSIQNGTEGIALDYNGNLIQFLSYEGTFTGSGGVADGVLSEDIGVSETNTTTTGTSMQLVGTGNSYSDFTWSTGVTATPGTSNGSQVLPVELVEFKGKVIDGSVTIEWSTATEIDNSGFEIQKSLDGKYFEKIGFVIGHGNSNEIINYEFNDPEFITEAYYRLKQVDYDGQSELSSVIYLNDPAVLREIMLYPNPINEKTRLSLSGISFENIDIQVYSMSGNKINTKNTDQSQLIKQLNQLEPGLYFMKLAIGSEVKLIKFIR